MKYSIIIPAHNSAAYIYTAIRSVKMQHVTDYELIVVCDACTDNTAQIAKWLADKVVIVNNHNDGLTRQAGMDVSSGDWILFMDDDDRWLHEYVLDIVDQYTTDDFDIIQFGFIFGEDLVGPVNKIGGIWPNVWSKVWRSDWIKKFRWKEIERESDLYFSREAIPDARMCFVDTPIYKYNYMRQGSQTEIAARSETNEKPLQDRT